MPFSAIRSDEVLFQAINLFKFEYIIEIVNTFLMGQFSLSTFLHKVEKTVFFKNDFPILSANFLNVIFCKITKFLFPV